MEPMHIPIMVEEILAFAAASCSSDEKKHIPLIVDATLGEGGHTLAFRKTFPDARILSLDRDRKMLDRAAMRLEGEGIPVTRIEDGESWNEALMSAGTHGVAIGYSPFGQLAVGLQAESLNPDFLLIDLGVSLFHFRGASRGFSYTDQQLDMRLDASLEKSATDLVNQLPVASLEQIFREYGEERYAGRIARVIVEDRPHSSAKGLAASVLRALPARKGQKGDSIHPATRVFQALRMAVNDEPGELGRALASIPPLLAPGGSIAFLTFHSIEDRAVKQAFRSMGVRVLAKDLHRFLPETLSFPVDRLKKRVTERGQKSGTAAPAVSDWKKRSSQSAPYWILTPTPLSPSMGEVQRNHASRSARLRVLRKSSDT